jgi:hypothetical protein
VDKSPSMKTALPISEQYQHIKVEAEENAGDADEE